MAKVIFEGPIANFRGKITTEQNVIFRTRNGRTHAYTVEHPNTQPHNEAQRAHTAAFGEVSRQVHAEMANPERLDYWQNEFAEYLRKVPKRRSKKAKLALMATSYSSRHKPVISTLYGYIFHTLFEQYKQNN